MTDHTHSQYVEGCYRCDLSRDEAALPGERPTWQHAVCPESVESLEGTVCPRCFLRRSLTGECGCDE